MGEVVTSTRPCLARDVLSTGTSWRNNSAVSGIRIGLCHLPFSASLCCKTRLLSPLPVLQRRLLVGTLHVVERMNCGSTAANGKQRCLSSTSARETANRCNDMVYHQAFCNLHKLSSLGPMHYD